MNMRTAFWGRLRHFTREEWGPEPDKVWAHLILTLDAIRAEADVPIVIHESWALGGHSEKSEHYRGNAVDFHFLGLNPMQQFVLLCSFRPGGLGWYPHWNNPGWHFDFRQRHAHKPSLYWWQNFKGEYVYGWQTLAAKLNGQ